MAVTSTLYEDRTPIFGKNTSRRGRGPAVCALRREYFQSLGSFRYPTSKSVKAITVKECFRRRIDIPSRLLFRLAQSVDRRGVRLRRDVGYEGEISTPLSRVRNGLYDEGSVAALQ
ncbi:hypothetical protein EVAR_12193_1 [Eumeta japonica]|uniref:Uncharacterized protein n=1 Tax=Eumeta variegata TaxID=151549 RepID=A0A4C1UIK4_EUMVA|nr:hypothetical protein EVAR_12193_1 [Eumeta japonica]